MGLDIKVLWIHGLFIPNSTSSSLKTFGKKKKRICTGHVQTLLLYLRASKLEKIEIYRNIHKEVLAKYNAISKKGLRHLRFYCLPAPGASPQGMTV